MSKRQRFTAGRYYSIAPTGEARPLQPPDGTVPDVVIGRRVVDFPQQRVPEGGTVVACDRCGAPVVTNLAKFPTVPRRCMQCEHVTPLPFDESH